MHAQLTAELARRLAAETDLSYQDYEVLVALTDQSGVRLRVHELGEGLGWEKSRLSHHLARMVDRGLVRKEPCKSDRRGAYVVVTARGRRTIEAAAPGHVAAVRDVFVGHLDPSHLDAIAEAADRILDGLEHSDES